MLNPRNTFSSIKRVVGRHWSEVQVELQRASYEGRQAEDGGVKIWCPARCGMHEVRLLSAVYATLNHMTIQLTPAGVLPFRRSNSRATYCGTWSSRQRLPCAAEQTLRFACPDCLPQCICLWLAPLASQVKVQMWHAGHRGARPLQCCTAIGNTGGWAPGRAGPAAAAAGCAVQPACSCEQITPLLTSPVFVPFPTLLCAGLSEIW